MLLSFFLDLVKRLKHFKATNYHIISSLSQAKSIEYIMETYSDRLIRLIAKEQARKLKEVKERNRLNFKVTPHEVILPNSTFRKAWDYLVAAVMVYYLTSMPFFIGNKEELETSFTFHTLECQIDGIFFSDIVLNLLTGYKDETNNIISDTKSIINPALPY